MQVNGPAAARAKCQPRLRNLENLEELCVLMRGKRGEVRDVKLSWRAELCRFGKERNNRWRRSKGSRKRVLGVGRAKQGNQGSWLASLLSVFSNSVLDKHLWVGVSLDVTYPAFKEQEVNTWRSLTALHVSCFYSVLVYILANLQWFLDSIS